MSDMDSVGIIFGAGISLIFFIINIFYCLSLHKAMCAIPADKQIFPGWLIWLTLIPLVGLIFSWIMEPFGIPRTFEKATADNPEAVSASKSLFGIGLAHVICLSILFIPIINIFAGIAALILWVIYWVKVVSFKNLYLHKSTTHTPIDSKV